MSNRQTSQKMKNNRPRRSMLSLRDMMLREQRGDIEQRQAQRVREQLH